MIGAEVLVNITITYQLSSLVSFHKYYLYFWGDLEQRYVWKGVISEWLHGLSLTPSVAEMFSRLNYSVKACYSSTTPIISAAPWLPLGRHVAWNPEAGVQLTPIESVISQDCQVGDALAAQDEQMLIRCSSSAPLFDIRAALPLCPRLSGWAGVELPVLFLCQTRVQGSSNNSQKLRSQHESEPTGTDCCGTSRLLQTRVDPSTACPSFYLPNPLLWTPLTAAYGYEESLGLSTLLRPF